MRRWPKAIVIAWFGLAGTLEGCGPAVDRDELGEVIFTVPKVPGAETPYLMPEPYFPEGGPPAEVPARAPKPPSSGEDAAN